MINIEEAKQIAQEIINGTTRTYVGDSKKLALFVLHLHDSVNQQIKLCGIHGFCCERHNIKIPNFPGPIDCTCGCHDE